MVIEINFTSATYSTPLPAEDDRYSENRFLQVCHIYEENVSIPRIMQQLPNGAIIEDTCAINAKFEVDGDKLLGWLLENGELK